MSLRFFFNVAKMETEKAIEFLKSRNRTIEVYLREGFSKDFPKNRDYAYSMKSDGKFYIIFAPKMRKALRNRTRAILRHEIAHIIYMMQGNDSHTEQDADNLAERIWGDRIYYDSEDIQTLDIGRYPRPAYLPK